jgi:hypothetical protein
MRGQNINEDVGWDAMLGVKEARNHKIKMVIISRNYDVFAFS